MARPPLIHPSTLSVRVPEFGYIMGEVPVLQISAVRSYHSDVDGVGGLSFDTGHANTV